MAMQDVASSPWGRGLLIGNATSNLDLTAITAGTHRCAFVFPAPRSGTIRAITWRNGVTSGTYSARISLQDLDSNGDPDGTADQFRAVTFGSNAFASSGIITSDGTDSGSKRTVTAGQMIAVVFDTTSFTSGTLRVSAGREPVSVAAYGDAYNGTSWTKQAAAVPLLAIEWDDAPGFYETIGIVAVSINGTTLFNNTSTPDEIALKMVPAITERIGGAALNVDADGAFDVVLYDSGGTALQTVSVASANRSGTNLGATLVYFPGTTLTAGQTYYLAVKPTSGTNIGLTTFAIANANHTRQVYGPGTWCQSARTDAGSWTDATTTLPAIVPLFTGVDTGSGGGPIVHPGMDGGFAA